METSSCNATSKKMNEYYEHYIVLKIGTHHYCFIFKVIYEENFILNISHKGRENYYLRISNSPMGASFSSLGMSIRNAHLGI